MSTHMSIVSVRIDEKTKKALEKAGINLSKEVKKFIESSSLSKFLNREDGWEDVSKELEAGCISVELAIKEVGNSLWRRVQRGEITGNTASKVYNTFLQHLPLRLADQRELYGDAI